jgi:hypothetical protein
VTPVRLVSGFPSAAFRVLLKLIRVGTTGLEEEVVDCPSTMETAMQIDHKSKPARSLLQNMISPGWRQIASAPQQARRVRECRSKQTTRQQNNSLRLD